LIHRVRFLKFELSHNLSQFRKLFRMTVTHFKVKMDL